MQRGSDGGVDVGSRAVALAVGFHGGFFISRGCEFSLLDHSGPLADPAALRLARELQRLPHPPPHPLARYQPLIHPKPFLQYLAEHPASAAGVLLCTVHVVLLPIGKGHVERGGRGKFITVRVLAEIGEIAVGVGADQGGRPGAFESIALFVGVDERRKRIYGGVVFFVFGLALGLGHVEHRMRLEPVIVVVLVLVLLPVRVLVILPGATVGTAERRQPCGL